MENTVIGKFFEGVSEIIEDLPSGIINGLAWLLFFVVFLWLILYVWLWGFFTGHHVRGFWILGIWAVLELANLIGSDKKDSPLSFG